MSRKSMVAQLLDRPVDERLVGSLALAMLAAERGAAIIRVHDVAATVDVLKVLAAVVE
jgi:dihydropteroate synthase